MREENEIQKNENESEDDVDRVELWSELFVALVAHEIPSARVNHHMPCEVTVLCTPIITHVA